MIKDKKIAFIFPGQGSQYVGMGKDFYDTIDISRQTIDTACRLLDFDLKHVLFEENTDINITEYTQAAMLAVSVAMLKALEEKGIRSDVNAGLSLGEYGALVASGVMDFETAVLLVRKRGIYMQEEVPPSAGAMAAGMAMDTDTIYNICAEVTAEERAAAGRSDAVVQIANYNCPGQIVISGDALSVGKASERLKEAGAKRVVPLNVSGPFHSEMLVGAGEKLGKELKGVVIHPIETPYFSNVTGMVVNESGEVKDLLKQQVYSSVKWQQCVENMIRMGVNTFIEIGPGKTLSSFVKKTDRTVTVTNIEKAEDLEKVMEVLSC